MLCQYIPPLKVLFSNDELPKTEQSRVMTEIQCKIFMSYIRQDSVPKKRKCENVLDHLANEAYPENAVRGYIDDLINKITRNKEMTVLREEQLKVDGLPISKPDYTIYYKRRILGCLETKASGAITKKSIVQGILQLISLREKASNTLFNIITDGYQYIFILYERDGTFKLESLQKTRQKRLKIHTVKKREDLEEIVAIVDALLQSGQDEVDRENPVWSILHCIGGGSTIRLETKADGA